jgi:hypothetical protein
MIRSSKKTAKKKRAEHKVIKAIRPVVAERDGHCRIAKDWTEAAIGALSSGPADPLLDLIRVVGTCAGTSEWAHIGQFKRFKTRGLPPDVRHRTTHSLMLCMKHHRAYDANQFVIEELTDRGANGPLAYRLR